MNLQEIKEHIQRLNDCITRIEMAQSQIEVTKTSEHFSIFSSEQERLQEIDTLQARLERFEETLCSELRLGALLQ